MKKVKKTSYYTKTYSDITEISIALNEIGVGLTRARIKEIPFSNKKKVLDVACGVSTLSKTFSDEVYGFDINHEAIEICRKNGIKAKFGDAEKKWDYPDGYFDIVIMSHIIEHVVNPDHLLSEARRVLKRKGLVIINTPNLAAWFNRILLLFGFQPFFTEVSSLDKTLGLKFTRKLTPYTNPLGHLRVFTGVALKDIMEMHGFKLIKKSGLEFFVLPRHLLILDRIFSHSFSLASNLIAVGKKI